jgi:TM2 domain-containing membrane protein YozV
MAANPNTHSVFLGYVAWLFGFLGLHRFYYGKTLTGIIWFFTLGLLFIGWILDLFLIPSMDREAQRRFTPGLTDYSVAWLLLIFLGLLGIGWLYDLCTLNQQISDLNMKSRYA